MAIVATPTRSAPSGAAAPGGAAHGRPAAQSLWPRRVAAWFDMRQDPRPAFMLASLAVVTLITALTASSFAAYLTRNMLERDATFAMQLVNSIVKAHDASDYFTGSASKPELVEVLRQIAEIQGVVRTNAYALDRSVVWSSRSDFIGRHLTQNQGLEKAFSGRPYQEIELIDEDHDGDHSDFPLGLDQLSESYLPIWSADRTSVVGAVELYRDPDDLLAMIRRGVQMIWFTSLAGAVTLLLCLWLFMSKATEVLKEQEARMVLSERLALVGEMTSAVAHALRNPLASIRSSAELALLDSLPQPAREPIASIVAETDRLAAWIRAFLDTVRLDGPGTSDAGPADVEDVLRSCLDAFAAQFRAKRIDATIQGADPTQPLRTAATAAELSQVVTTLLSNAVEAMDDGGELVVARNLDPDGFLRLEVVDSGEGLPEEIADQIFEPFVTGKPSGLGVGLPLARRIVERLGGTLNVANNAGAGATATVRLPCNAAESTRAGKESLQ